MCDLGKSLHEEGIKCGVFAHSLMVCVRQGYGHVSVQHLHHFASCWLMLPGGSSPTWHRNFIHAGLMMLPPLLLLWLQCSATRRSSPPSRTWPADTGQRRPGGADAMSAG